MLPASHWSSSHASCASASCIFMVSRSALSITIQYLTSHILTEYKGDVQLLSRKGFFSLSASLHLQGYIKLIVALQAWHTDQHENISKLIENKGKSAHAVIPSDGTRQTHYICFLWCR